MCLKRRVGYALYLGCEHYGTLASAGQLKNGCEQSSIFIENYVHLQTDEGDE